MLETVSKGFKAAKNRLLGKAELTPEVVDESLRDIRVALLEADVSFDVVKKFVARVREKAIGVTINTTITDKGGRKVKVAPGDHFVKICHDELEALMGPVDTTLPLKGKGQLSGIMMVGLQGSGKTTSTAKIAKRLTDRDKRKVLMASLDTRRPAAMEQLAILGKQIGVETLPIVAGQTAVQIAHRAVDAARLGGYDVVMLDTAGRVTLDEALMLEVAEVKAATNPHEVLLVADALTGQDAVNTARAFDGRVGLTGIVLTRMDGDGRGGAALSMRAVTGKPIKLVGTGEKVDALEEFHPGRVANRILGMGDIVSLVEKAAANIDQAEAQKMAERMAKGKFDLNDMRSQLNQMMTMGGIGGVMGMLPGIAKAKAQMASANLDDKVIKRQIAIIDSMTRAERADPELLKASRKRRIAAGSGTSPEAINKLLKMHRGMADMMKMMGKQKGGFLGKMGQMFGIGGGGMPDMDPSKMTPEQLEQIKKLSGGKLPPGFGGGKGLPPMPPGLGGGGSMPKLPGLGNPGLPGPKGGLPGLGFNPFGGKKK
jgi:signal recognition particle subunit SRP54